jgi:hypothetical protein
MLRIAFARTLARMSLCSSRSGTAERINDNETECERCDPDATPESSRANEAASCDKIMCCCRSRERRVMISTVCYVQPRIIELMAGSRPSVSSGSSTAYIDRLE